MTQLTKMREESRSFMEIQVLPPTPATMFPLKPVLDASKDVWVMQTYAISSERSL